MDIIRPITKNDAATAQTWVSPLFNKCEIRWTEPMRQRKLRFIV